MSDPTITSANSSFVLTAAGLFPVPFQVQGYSTDRSFLTEQQQMAEVQMGVDGKMSAGYTPTPVKMTITLQADSPAREFFRVLAQSTKTRREVYFLNGVITLPGTGETYNLTRGILTAHSAMPGAQKVLQPRDYEITWESVTPSVF